MLRRTCCRRSCLASRRGNRSERRASARLGRAVARRPSAAAPSDVAGSQVARCLAERLFRRFRRRARGRPRGLTARAIAPRRVPEKQGEACGQGLRCAQQRGGLASGVGSCIWSTSTMTRSHSSEARQDLTASVAILWGLIVSCPSRSTWQTNCFAHEPHNSAPCRGKPCPHSPQSVPGCGASRTCPRNSCVEHPWQAQISPVAPAKLVSVRLATGAARAARAAKGHYSLAPAHCIQARACRS